MGDRIETTLTDEGVADVRLVRTDKMNALDNAMFEALIETGQHLKEDTRVRAVVLSGEGRAFCAGLDMSNFAAMAGAGSGDSGGGGSSGRRDQRLATREYGIANRAQYAVWVWREVPVPVIAAVHGVAFGGGLQLCLGADMRYVTADTRMCVMEINWGLVPDMGGTQIMRELVRDDVVRELVYTGREFSGEEAVAIGMATRVCEDPRATAMEAARIIAGLNPDAIEASKRLCNQAPFVSPAEGLMAESVEQDKLIGSPNQVEAVMSRLERRPGRFNPPQR